LSNPHGEDPGDDGKTVFVDGEVEPQVMQIIKNAKSQITFGTPYIELWEHLKYELLAARKRKVQVLFFIRVGATPRDPTDLPWLRSNISVLYDVPNLHSKIYLNEKTVLISSMNITEGSTRNSMEIAMLVRRQGDALELRDYVNGLPAKSTSKQLPSIGGYVSGLIRTAVVQSLPQSLGGSSQGYCIRGRERIAFDPDHPFCAPDYQLWAKWKKEDYAEKYCHSCGKLTNTSFRNPECTDCYKLHHPN
jgi:phosphatidylserine/phosphatidylglycerophosphate/cardiolipin synthase-like enzyme